MKPSEKGDQENMKRIILFCANGLSTSLLVKNMEKAALGMDDEYSIEAFGLTQMKEKGKGADAILLGPQVRYAVSQVQKQYPDIPVLAIDMRAYGLMDGKTVMASVETALHQ